MLEDPASDAPPAPPSLPTLPASPQQLMVSAGENYNNKPPVTCPVPHLTSQLGQGTTLLLVHLPGDILHSSGFLCPHPQEKHPHLMASISPSNVNPQGQRGTSAAKG